MVDISRPWVVDNELSERWPVYTRANAGEVAGTVATPLFWTMVGGPPAEREWKQALAEFGAFDLDEFRPDELDIQGLVHGYVYLNMSNMRTFGARMPGASPQLMDRTYLGDNDAPAYVPHPDDDRPEYTQRIVASVERVLKQRSRPDIDGHREVADMLRAMRPPLSELTDEELLQRERRVMRTEYPEVIRTHLRLVYEGSVVTAALDDVLAPLGDPGMAVTLMSGLGNIVSAAPNEAMWRLGRQVKSVPSLTEEFDRGVRGLEQRLRARPDEDARTFLAGFDELLYEFGSRSTQEWEVNAKTWESVPSIPLGMIDRLRLQPDDKDPCVQRQRLRDERGPALAEVRARLADNPDRLAKLDAALESASVYSSAREQSKSNCVRVLHEARLAIAELGRRLAAREVFSDPDDIVMVREDELDALIKDPAPFAAIVAGRWEWWHRLSELEPPITIEAGNVPPVTHWPRRQDPSTRPVASGETLRGIPACAGIATGVAKIITDPENGVDLEPGEILVAPLTDPGWTPLFTAADAVVVNVGSTMSHAAIVSRELGIPCVLGVKDATKRIADGTMVTVNGTAGTILVH